jgi:hypothetical protein
MSVKLSMMFFYAGRKLISTIIDLNDLLRNQKERLLLTMSKIQDKVVVVMGASSGIGEATTKKLAQEGAKLVIAARREDRLKALVESLPNAEISYAAADVTNKEEVQAENRKQEGNPAKLAKALITIASQEEPPFRWIAGADAIAGAEQKVTELQEQINAYRDLSTSLDYEDA